jgi:hypothetical protein
MEVVVAEDIWAALAEVTSVALAEAAWAASAEVT